MKNIVIIIFMLSFIIEPIKVYALGVSAEYACVIEQDSGEIVYEKNSRLRHSMASTTKIMTAILAIENGGLDDVVTVSRNAMNQEGSSIYLRENDKIVMRDLVYGLMLNSGNDAAVAIAEHIGGSTDAFAKLMTAKAVEIGAVDTQFKNPNGLDADGHYTTAYDLALIARYAMCNSEFKNIVSTKSKKIVTQNNQAEIYLSNHNKMLKIYDGANGVKTGYTRATGRCLVSSAQRNDMSFIAVTLNAPDDWNDHKNMLDYAFENYERCEAVKKGEVLKTISASDGRKIEICASDSVWVTMRKNCAKKCNVILHLAQEIDAPLNAMEKVGVSEIVYNNAVIAKMDLLNKNEICVYAEKGDKKSFSEYLTGIIKCWLAV